MSHCGSPKPHTHFKMHPPLLSFFFLLFTAFVRTPYWGGVIHAWKEELFENAVYIWQIGKAGTRFSKRHMNKNVQESLGGVFEKQRLFMCSFNFQTHHLTGFWWLNLPSWHSGLHDVVYVKCDATHAYQQNPSFKPTVKFMHLSLKSSQSHSEHVVFTHPASLQWVSSLPTLLPNPNSQVVM